MIKKVYKTSLIVGTTFLSGILFTIFIAYFFGSYSERTQRDPITNRVKVSKSRLSIHYHEEISKDEISVWVDQHLPDRMYYGQYGWLTITSTHRSWFDHPAIGCGGPGGYPTIPELIYNNEITKNGMTKEEILKEFLSEVPAAYKINGNLKQLIEKWRKE